MSGPFGVRIKVISGQNYSREIVVAASTFLSMRFLTIDPVAAHARLKQDFLMALSMFCSRERIHYYEGPRSFAASIIQPSKTISTGGLFWLAMDQEGEALAKSVFQENGKSPDERVYHSVRKLNRIEQTIPSPPIRTPFLQKLFSRRLSLPEPTPSFYREYLKSHPGITPEIAQCYAWFEVLYEALIPWMDIIKNIQSDYS